MKKNRQRAFTLVELVVVLSVVALLAGVVIPSGHGYLRTHRDARRLAHIELLAGAIERYHADHQSYPEPVSSRAFGGWEASCEGSFLQVLVDEGYLDHTLLDPINDANFHYRYWVYQPGRYDCGGRSSYFVLGIKSFESEDFAREHRSLLACRGRDWGREFAYACGAGATFER